MIYFKEIDLANFEKIKKESQLYFSKWARLPIGFTLLDKERFLKNCPELISSAKEAQIGIKNIGAYITYHQSDSKVHIDYINPIWNQCRLNIPILNTEGSLTEFYSGGNFQEVRQENNLTYLESIDESYIKVTEVEMLRPTIIRVQTPHRVNTNTNKVPRICLTIFTDVDLVKFLNE